MQLWLLMVSFAMTTALLAGVWRLVYVAIYGPDVMQVALPVGFGMVQATITLWVIYDPLMVRDLPSSSPRSRLIPPPTSHPHLPPSPISPTHLPYLHRPPAQFVLKGNAPRVSLRHIEMVVILTLAVITFALLASPPV